MIESRITSVFANGYEVKDLKGKRAKEIEAKAIVNISEKRILNYIIGETVKYFPEAKIRIHTLPSIATNEISNEIDRNNFLLVLSEDEITEICLVKERQSTESVSVPFGKNSILREIIKKDLAADPNSADSMLKMYEEGYLEEAKKESFEEVLNEISNIFLIILRDALFKSFKKGKHPETIVILSSSKETNPILKKIFNDHYISRGGGKDFIKLLSAKDTERSALFSAAVLGIKKMFL